MENHDSDEPMKINKLAYRSLSKMHFYCALDEISATI